MVSLTSTFLLLTWNCKGGSFDVEALVENLTDDPCKGHDLYAARAALAQRARRRVRRRAARVDVVDQADAGRRVARRGERSGDVAPAVGKCQPALAGGRACPAQERGHRERPAL